MNIETEFKNLIAEIEQAGEHARAYFDADSTQNDIKQDGTVVTEVDQKIERVLREYIDEYFPDDSIVGEEEAGKEGTSGFVWHVDPIDGTDNFLRKIPFCAISVARLGDGPEDSFGIVHNPITKQTFASLMENGTYENNRITNLTAENLGGRYVMSIGCGRKKWMQPALHKLMWEFRIKYGKSRSYGATALELAYVAANRIDANLTFGLNTYDYAAGLYLVKAAGGKISVFEDGVWQEWVGSIKDLCDRHGKTIFASHPDVHDEMRDFIGDTKSWVE